jgi:hypothetical protein
MTRWNSEQVVRLSNELLAQVASHPEKFSINMPAAPAGADLAKAASGIKFATRGGGIQPGSLDVVVEWMPFLAPFGLRVLEDLWERIILPHLESKLGPKK